VRRARPRKLARAHVAKLTLYHIEELVEVPPGLGHETMYEVRKAGRAAVRDVRPSSV
jgi:hypothetical protein